MTPFWCACWIASQTWMNRRILAAVPTLCVSQYSSIGTPRTSSMTKYGRPSAVAPASSTWAMLGWFMSARAWRSASKRATTSLVSMPGLMILSATSRCTGSACTARYTAPIPPSPRSSWRR